MPFILPDTFLSNLQSLRLDYETRTQKSLAKPAQPYAVSRFFGKKDTKARAQQIQFIDKWLISLNDKLKPSLTFSKEEEIQEHLMALRILVAVIFYIRHQIDTTYKVRSGRHAVLAELLEAALKIDKSNTVDKITHDCCLITALRFTSEKGKLSEMNALITALSTEEDKLVFSELEWHEFTTYLSSQCANVDKSLLNSYPVTSIMMPLFALPMRAAGNSIGYLFGDILGKSSALLPARYAITAAFGSGLILMMGPSTAMGVMLIAPTYAGRIFDNFFGVSLAYVLGSAMGLIGSGLGWSVGMTLDVSWKLLYYACAFISHVYCGAPKPSLLTGFNLAEGQRFVDGIAIKVTEIQEHSANPELQVTELDKNIHYDKHPILFETVEGGFIVTIGSEKAEIKWNSLTNKNLPYMEQLKNNLAMKPIIEEITEDNTSALAYSSN